MKTLSDASFFRVFNLLVGTSNPGQKLDSWTIDDVHFERERHTFGGRTYCFAIDVFALSRVGRRGWSLIVVKEFWWDGGHRRSIRTQGWSKLAGGSRRDVMVWLRGQEQRLERQT